VAEIERSASPCSEPDVAQLRERLTALDLQLQETSVQANQQLSLLHCNHEQRLQLLRQLEELRRCDDDEASFPDLPTEEDLLVSSLPCLALPPLASPRTKKHEKIIGLKKAAISSAWGRVLSSKLNKSPASPAVSHSTPALPPSPPSATRTGKRGSSQFYAPLLPEHQKRTPLNVESQLQMGSDEEEDEERYTKTEISPEALAEISAFKQLIQAYFAGHCFTQSPELQQYL
ncbi:uncharacterized protein LOC108671411, partial [Hyalella azteca]|uniref:Uncharacterized protein LOC108671411 n=1 Tax=Hyalella azteca TaxID=294128 RepID=A0A8B7NML7_HYAAZ